MARILIAGCGDVGTTLGLSLRAAGHEVWGLKRNPRGLPPELRPLAADLADPATLIVLPPALDYIVYSAAAAGFSEALYQAAYVAGVRNLLNALRQAGQQPKRLLLTSSTSVYAQHQGEWVDEDSPAAAEASRAVASVPANNCCRTVVGRRWWSVSVGSTVPAAPA